MNDLDRQLVERIKNRDIEGICRSCGYDTDDDGYCNFCGKLNITPTRVAAQNLSGHQATTQKEHNDDE